MASFDLINNFLGVRDAFAPTLKPYVPPPPKPPVELAPNPMPGMRAPAAGRGADMWGEFEKLFGNRLRFTSGYRDPAHNARVGGVPNSLHMNAANPARDYAGSAKDMFEAAAWAKQNGAREALVHNAGSGQHLHVAW